jgi:hypothetical protein
MKDVVDMIEIQANKIDSLLDRKPLRRPSRVEKSDVCLVLLLLGA